MLFKRKILLKIFFWKISSLNWYFCFLWNGVFSFIFYIKGFVDLACFYTSNEMVPLWGMAHWAEGARRQWLRSVIRSCSPHPCWLESTGRRPFSLGKQYMNHLNWHKLSGMLLNVFYSPSQLRELGREACSLSLKVS